ncbi:MAG: PQQ-binding-like beta-propeller repeat protein [Candidatus Bathyarchaeota archaeon]|nr:PQQ-binding-like beta-propeller repeat protein [Candidatus Bathyarchaeota archaeon]
MKNQSKVFTAILTLLLCTSAVAGVSIASAHDPPWTIPTWTYATVTADTVGVNQDLGVVFWANAVPPTAMGSDGDRWTFNIEVTKPDGSTETIGPITSDPVGGGYITYVPDQVGEHTLVAKFVEHEITGLPVPPAGYFMGGEAYIGDTYTASESKPVQFTVQADTVESWQEPPLPTEYWTRPINSANRNWYVLAGNWLSGAAQNVGPTTGFGYGPAPESAHVMWAREIWNGGIMDERFGPTGYQTYHYEGLHFIPPIVLNGKLYYNVENLPKEGWYCVDLYTGETEYFHNTTGPVTDAGGNFDYSGRIAGEQLSFGQIYNYESPNQHGGMAYLWSQSAPTPNTWMMFDAYSGSYICSINNVPAGVGYFGPADWGTRVYGKDGSILLYNIVGTTDPTNPFAPATEPFYLQCWNTSRAIWYEPVFTSNNYWMWRPTLNMTFDGNNGYSLNVTVPAVQGSVFAVREDQYIIGGTSGKNNGTFVQQGHIWALSLKPGEEGTLLWNVTYTPPETEAPDIISGLFGSPMQGPTVDPEDGVFFFKETVSLKRWGFDLETGEQLWESEPEAAGNYYGMTENIYEGKLLTTGYGGELLAYDVRTGDAVWKYTASNIGFESPYGNYPLGIGAIADGKIYLGSGEHSPTQPLWRGSHLICINASNGAELWKYQQLGVSMPSGNGGDNFAVADGYLLALNAYDNKIYCFGKGPSETTVTASPVIGSDKEVLIQGTVTDQSAGAKGRPAISDVDQQAWMEYVYQQQIKPTDAAGVPVHITAIDPNGNFQDIGTATSDILGNYVIHWVPPVPGLYTVTAEFEGSNSYYASEAGISFYVAEPTAAAVTPATTPAHTVAPTASAPASVQSISPLPSEAPQPSTTAGTPTWTYIAIAAAIITIIAAATTLLLRKRK